MQPSLDWTAVTYEPEHAADVLLTAAAAVLNQKTRRTCTKSPRIKTITLTIMYGQKCGQKRVCRRAVLVVMNQLQAERRHCVIIYAIC